MKKALVLGVGSAQVDLIRFLKHNGWWVIGCSYRREGRGLDFVDQFELVDIKNIGDVLSLAQTERVELIYSIGSDVAMPTIGAVACKVGLPYFVPYETATLMHNKVALRTFLCQRGISPVHFIPVKRIEDLEGWDHYPALMKPVDGQGQRGVVLVNSLAESRAHFERVIGHSFSQTAILEEFLDGAEISVNVFCKDSTPIVMEISDRLVVAEYPGGIPKSHIYPSQSCQGKEELETYTLVKRCSEALGIREGPLYFQIKLTKNGPRIIEIAPRLDGCHMWRLIKTVTGMDLLEMTVKHLTGEAITIKENLSAKTAHSLSFFYTPPGTVFRQDDFQPPSDAIFVDYYYREHEIVRPINSFIEKVGYFIRAHY